MKTCTVPARMLAAAMLFTAAGFACAQATFPNRPIRLIVPYAAGGGTTPVARLVGQKLTESWGQQVVIDNRPGGNTIIGTEALVKSAPDGYTLLMVTNAHVINPNLLPTPYDAIRDFSPVATLISGELLLVLHPSVPANTLKELIALAKAKPGQINYASASNGGVVHLAGELFNMMAGVKIQHIPYKGGGPALTDLIGGHVQMYLVPAAGVIGHIVTGRIKAIAISGERHSAALPQVPTFTEAGLPGYDAKTWFGILAPANTPARIVAMQSKEIARILTLPEIQEKLVSQGLDPFVSTPEQFATLLKASIARYASIIKSANIKLEN